LLRRNQEGNIRRQKKRAKKKEEESGFKKAKKTEGEKNWAGLVRLLRA